MKTMYRHNKQQGAALIVGLVLLVVITVLAISGMNTATTELAMARNDQNYENAFQAAETGLETILALGTFDTAGAAAVTKNVNYNDTVVTQVAFEDSSIVPDKAFSLGSGSGVSAYHFLATATSESLRDPGATTDRDSSAVHTQAFYVVGPESPTL
jgi:type IV pilus assembly protein PilX